MLSCLSSEARSQVDNYFRRLADYTTQNMWDLLSLFFTSSGFRCPCTTFYGIDVNLTSTILYYLGLLLRLWNGVFTFLVGVFSMGLAVMGSDLDAVASLYRHGTPKREFFHYQVATRYKRMQN